jgi:hypothetical protein
MLRCALTPSIRPNDLLGVPIEHHHDVDPPEVLHQHLGHIDAPPFVRPGGLGFAPCRGPLRFELQVGGHQQMVLSHEAQEPLLVDRQLFHEAQVRPNAAVTAERVLRLQRLDPCQ